MNLCDLTGFALACGRRRIGGVVLVEYLPIAYVNRAQSHTLHDQTNTDTGQLSMSSNWFPLHCLQNGRVLNDKNVTTEQGEHLEREVTADLSGADSATLLELRRMVGQRFMVRITDKQRTRYLCSDHLEGMEFSYSFTTGQPSSGQRISLSFRGQFATHILAS